MSYNFKDMIMSTWKLIKEPDTINEPIMDDEDDNSILDIDPNFDYNNIYITDSEEDNDNNLSDSDDEKIKIFS